MSDIDLANNSRKIPKPVVILFIVIKVMGTIASELKAPSQNTPHSSIIL